MSPTIKHLSAFQRDILYIVSDLETSYGLGIKEALEEYYGEDVNTGRVYQNLSTLVEEGYLEKSAIDKRTNSYTLTEKALRAIEHRHRWQRTRADGQLAG
ncbi:PadR family transcriptional regulator [Halonotius roseus]|uniref:PadR family transcriptional regulator n=1 Tax=Halonotius roseus TaxID=2511997 RepID=UPI002AA2AC17|nr:helix-turn-helix transcriptional regulator [Halonotius roseus]